MKRILLFFIFLILCSYPVFAAEEGDSWSELQKSGDLWGQQKAVTDAEFEEVMKRFEKKPKKNKKMGQDLYGDRENLDPEMSVVYQMQEAYPTILIPMRLNAQGHDIEPGYYRVISQKNADDSYNIILYQGNTLSYKLVAKPVHDYNDNPEMNFAVLEPFDQSYMRLVFGCIDYNLDVYLKIVK